eukprot:6188984-Pleurochrysis_carterae.AAC.1
MALRSTATPTHLPPVYAALVATSLTSWSIEQNARANYPGHVISGRRTICCRTSPSDAEIKRYSLTSSSDNDIGLLRIRSLPRAL